MSIHRGHIIKIARATWRAIPLNVVEGMKGNRPRSKIGFGDLVLAIKLNLKKRSHHEIRDSTGRPDWEPPHEGLPSPTQRLAILDLSSQEVFTPVPHRSGVYLNPIRGHSQ